MNAIFVMPSLELSHYVVWEMCPLLESLGSPLGSAVLATTPMPLKEPVSWIRLEHGPTRLSEVPVISSLCKYNFYGILETYNNIP